MTGNMKKEKIMGGGVEKRGGGDKKTIMSFSGTGDHRIVPGTTSVGSVSVPYTVYCVVSYCPSLFQSS